MKEDASTNAALSLDNARRFFQAFKEIESFLRRRVEGADKDTKFAKLIADAADMDIAMIREYQGELLRYSFLRNALAHNPESKDRQVIAYPRTDVVEHIETIAQNLTSPPYIESIIRNEVHTVMGNQLITNVARNMKDRDFSQAPVVDAENRFQALLTTNTIARWFADAATDGQDIHESEVREVIDYQESDHECVVKASEDDLFQVVHVFRRDADHEVLPYAVVITKDGADDGKVKGIITPYDLHVVFDKLHMTPV